MFFVWRNLHCELQSSAVYSVESGSEREMLKIVSFSSFLLVFSSHLLTNSITFCPCHFYPLPATVHTAEPVHTSTHTFLVRTEKVSTVLISRVQVHTDACSHKHRSAPQRHLHFSRTNFLTLLHFPRLLLFLCCAAFSLRPHPHPPPHIDHFFI